MNDEIHGIEPGFHGVDEECDSAEIINVTELETAGTQVHLCNTVVDLIPEKKFLHSMWEDSDLEGNEKAVEHYKWLEDSAPGAFVLIDTGDYIVPPCIANSGYDRLHEHCETYDAAYNLYLVPMKVWNACGETVLKADREWREKAKQCQRVAIPERRG